LPANHTSFTHSNLCSTPLTDWDPPADTAPDTRNNAELVDRGCDAQALCTADIEAMKAEGTAGADIVAALTANSVTFAAKTEYSQAKYK
jgi:tRNA (adenine-N(1)-)-methyltransferase non-catalytic subunit